MARPIVPVRLSNTETGAWVLAWAFLDTASDKDFIDLDVALQIGIPLSEEVMTVSTVEGKVSTMKHMGNITLSSIDKGYEAEVEDAVFATFPSASNDIPPCRRDLSKFPYMSDVQFPEIDGDKISVILSAAHHGAWIGGEVRRGRPGQPWALNTAFGWTLSGPTGKKGESDMASFKIAVESENLEADNQVLKKDIEKIFYQDFTVVSDEQVGDSKEAREALDQLKESARFDETKGKYIAGLCWKGGRRAAAAKLNAVDSQSMALKRLASLKRSMIRDEDKKTKAFEQVRKFIDAGRAEVVDEEELKVKPEDRVQWHLPGHLVHQNGKWRFCHDGRASVDGICLNEELIGALNLLTPLLGPIMHLRKPDS